MKEIPTEGHSPLLVLTSDFSPYYIKNTRGQNPATPIINEFVCHYLLKEWGLNTPDIAAVKVDVNILTSDISSFHRTYFYDDIAFGSKKLESVIELNEFFKINRKTDFDKFRSPLDLLKISLFDIWVENDDRKPTNPNLLLNTSGDKIDIIAIDNAFTFTTQNYDRLYTEGVSQSFNDNLLFSEFGQKIKDYIIKQNYNFSDLEDYFYICIERSKNNFDEIAENIPPNLGFTDGLKESLYDFLFDKKRNSLVLSDFNSRL